MEIIFALILYFCSLNMLYFIKYPLKSHYSKEFLQELSEDFPATKICTINVMAHSFVISLFNNHSCTEVQLNRGGYL